MMLTSIRDPVHGCVDLLPEAMAIIDTPEFQRLRDLKQLGATCEVYPSATHTRFEHSLGVAHLARTVVARLRAGQPELGLTDADELCVHLAGLVHDAGHGPFGHLWDSGFIGPLRAAAGQTRWTHEHASVAMFNHLLVTNKVDLGALSPQDVHFIGELVLGGPEQAPEGFKWVGAAGRNTEGTPPKDYLFDIVANKRTGVDVDKCDYVKRDCHHLGLGCTFDADLLLRGARAMDTGSDGWRICFPFRCVEQLDDLVESRRSLHRRAYQHHTVAGIEHLLCDAFVAADAKLGLSDSINDMHSYARVSDWVVHRIEFSHEPQLLDARRLVARIRHVDIHTKHTHIPTHLSFLSMPGAVNCTPMSARCICSKLRCLRR